MGDSNLGRARSAWEQAGDADLVRALKSVDEYPAAIQEIICKEAEQRQLTAETVFPETYPALRALARGVKQPWERCLRWIQKQPYYCAILLGATDPFLGAQLIKIGLIWLPLLTYMILLSLLNLRQKRYLVVIAAALVAAGVSCAFALGSQAILWMTHAPGDTVLFMRVILHTTFNSLGIKGVAAAILLCGIVWLRKRFWPVINPGRCRVCDYDLRGLPEPRCPECGTPFDPADGHGVMMEDSARE